MTGGHTHVQPDPEENDLPGEGVQAYAPVGTSLTIEWLQGAKTGTITVTEGTQADAIAALDYLRTQIIERSDD